MNEYVCEALRKLDETIIRILRSDFTAEQIEVKTESYQGILDALAFYYRGLAWDFNTAEPFEANELCNNIFDYNYQLELQLKAIQ